MEEKVGGEKALRGEEKGVSSADMGGKYPPAQRRDSIFQ
jgi:hypothetical protein